MRLMTFPCLGFGVERIGRSPRLLASLASSARSRRKVHREQSLCRHFLEDALQDATLGTDDCNGYRSVWAVCKKRWNVAFREAAPTDLKATGLIDNLRYKNAYSNASPSALRFLACR